MEEFDFMIVGAGVVGLAIATKLSNEYKDKTILLIEKHKSFGQETSSRNSEVIHSGIYYPKDSEKSRLCIEGNKLLYEFCIKYNIEHQKIGKLIIARNDQEIESINDLYCNAISNGVKNIELIDEKEIEKLEKNIKAKMAIYSKDTGIVNSHNLMKKLESICNENDVLLGYGNKFENFYVENTRYISELVDVNGNKELISSKCIINCGGLFADQIASKMGLDVIKLGYKIYPCKGEYFSIINSKSKLINHLIYPPPLKNLKGLGIHITKSLDGKVRLGPSAFYVDELDYDIDDTNLDLFYNSTKEFLPFIDRSDIKVDMSGIRPKIQGPNDEVKDFIINHEENNGLKGIINLIGIESPGLTSSLAIANYVYSIVKNEVYI